VVVFISDLGISGNLRERDESSFHSGRLRKSTRTGCSAQSADLHRDLGSVVIDVPPDASDDEASKPRWVRRTVCLARA
jgi:hypothetical protein